MVAYSMIDYMFELACRDVEAIDVYTVQISLG